METKIKRSKRHKLLSELLFNVFGLVTLLLGLVIASSFTSEMDRTLVFILYPFLIGLNLATIMLEIAEMVDRHYAEKFKV